MEIRQSELSISIVEMKNKGLFICSWKSVGQFLHLLSVLRRREGADGAGDVDLPSHRAYDQGVGELRFRRKGDQEESLPHFIRRRDGRDLFIHV